MPLVVPLFAVGFNLLLWLTRAALSPLVAARLGGACGWFAALVAPLALLSLAVRIEQTRREAFVWVSAASLLVAGLLAGS